MARQNSKMNEQAGKKGAFNRKADLNYKAPKTKARDDLSGAFAGDANIRKASATKTKNRRPEHAKTSRPSKQS